MVVITTNWSYRFDCDDVSEFVNLKCELMLVYHDKSQLKRKDCDVSRNS